jgi:hypothetical protein
LLENEDKSNHEKRDRSKTRGISEAERDKANERSAISARVIDEAIR